MFDLILISDTHCGHDGLAIDRCDVLVHAGDFTRHGTREEALPFFAWLGAQHAKAKVLIGGNHDLIAASDPDWVRALAREHSVLWLLDEAAEVCGLRVYGSPYSPKHGEWAFQDERGEPARPSSREYPCDSST